jgi:GTP-binding protein Era
MVPALIMAFRSGYVVGRPPQRGEVDPAESLSGQLVAAAPAPADDPRQLGILTTPEAQVISGTRPACIFPATAWAAMNLAAQQAIADADVVDHFRSVGAADQEDRLVAERLATLPVKPRLAAINKIDVWRARAGSRSLAFARVARLGILGDLGDAGDGCEALLSRLIEALRRRGVLPDQVTDAYEREIAADLIRAAAMRHLHQEVPHSLAVVVDEFQERGQEGARITATLYVERESQKGIVIGRGGEMLKTIGSEARREIEAMSGRSCYLELRVRVRPDWRSDPKALAEFGFHLPPPDRRSGLRMKRRATRSAFGSPGRVSHDLGAFYSARLYGDLPVRSSARIRCRWKSWTGSCRTPDRRTWPNCLPVAPT